MQNITRKKNRGFSLIEVMFGIFLMALCAAIVAAGMPIATKSRIKADYNNKATSLAQKQLEAVRGLGYANATAAQLYSNGLIDSTTLNPNGRYNFTNVDIGALDNPAKVLPQGTGEIGIEQVDLDLRRITVVVRWLDRGVSRSLTLGTLVANL